jgi:hypothetical protein
MRESKRAFTLRVASTRGRTSTYPVKSCVALSRAKHSNADNERDGNNADQRLPEPRNVILFWLVVYPHRWPRAGALREQKSRNRFSALNFVESR